MASVSHAMAPGWQTCTGVFNHIYICRCNEYHSTAGSAEVRPESCTHPSKLNMQEMFPGISGNMAWVDLLLSLVSTVGGCKWSTYIYVE